MVVLLTLITLLTHTEVALQSSSNHLLPSHFHDPEEHFQAKFDSENYGDYNFNILMSLTEDSDCKKVTLSGLLKGLAVKHVIGEINKSLKVLPNITIGYQFDDACLTLPIAMEKGITIAKKFREKECYANNQGVCLKNEAAKNNSFHAVIGAAYSFLTIPLASLFSLHNIPIVSPDASSPLLKKTTDFSSFFRIIPPDTFNMQAIMDVILYFKWSYIFAIGSDDDYGKDAITELKRLASANNVCLTGDMYIPFHKENSKIAAKQIINEILMHPRATVVILFSYVVDNGEHILLEADKLNISRIWLAGDVWNPDIFFAENLPLRQIKNVISVSWDFGPASKSFVDFVNKTIWRDFATNHMLINYIMYNHGCLIQKEVSEILIGYNYKNKSENCSVAKATLSNEILENIYQVNNLIDALHAAANGLNLIVNSRCTSQLCKPSIHPSELSEALKNVSFSNQKNETFQFDTEGNPKYFSYSIAQIQMIDGKARYVSIGRWDRKDNNRLDIFQEQVDWSLWGNRKPESSCSVDCQPGEYVSARQSCCWVCRACPSNEISDTINAGKCKSCSNDQYPYQNKECKKKEIIFLDYSDLLGVSISIFSILGISVVVALVGFFHCFGGGIKSLSSDFRFVLTVGIFLLLLTFIYSVFHLIDPSDTICQIQCVYFYLLLTSYNGILLVKNDSVSHFLSKYIYKKQKVWFAQVLLFIVLLVIEIILLIAWISTETDFVMLDNSNIEQYFKSCSRVFTNLKSVLYGFPVLILLIATVQSIADRKTSIINSDSRFLMFTCLCFDIINLAYFITLNNVSGKYEEMVVVFTVIIYGFAYISCMILPKLYTVITTRKNNPNQQQEGVINIGFERESCYYVNKVNQNNVGRTPPIVAKNET